MGTDDRRSAPMTWNSGVVSRTERCGAFGSGAGMLSPFRSIARTGPVAVFHRLVKNCRCVERTPFGNDVVPEVKKMVAWSCRLTRDELSVSSEERRVNLTHLWLQLLLW